MDDVYLIDELCLDQWSLDELHDAWMLCVEYVKEEIDELK